jgi:HD superfamily phosphohydrolase
MRFHKIINDPVYGFITIDDELIHQIIAHPYYQRLRRISQMALAHLVYPGATHTRMHHSLGAYHLMQLALQELSNKGVEISPEEQQATKIAILLHDIGHGPFSHALEHVLAEHLHHEELSLMMMQELNQAFQGKLQMALEIFTGRYPKKFLHQLISGQLDVDRMDYLTRDSFFTGVVEGAIGYDRIIKMLTVHNGELMVEEKGIYSIEKFLVARRLMYWQVYLHKTVVSAEQMLQRIIKRARAVAAICDEPLNSFINQPIASVTLQQFCSLDDTDVMVAIKKWSNHEDRILSMLCASILNRKLLKVKFYTEPINKNVLAERVDATKKAFGLSEEETTWLVFEGEASSRIYDFENEQIKILFKDNSVKDISEVDHALINEALKGKVIKHYLCYPAI